MLDTALMDALARRPPIWAAGAQDWWDFTRAGRAKRGVGAMPVETRASDGFAENEAGVWVRRTANTRSMAGKGLLTFPSRTNLFANTADLDGYLNTNADKVSITQNQPGPDGSANQAATFTVIGANEGRLRNLTIANDSATYACSFFVKKTTGTPTNYPGVFNPLTGGTGGASIVIVVNTTAGTANSSGSPGNLTITSYGEWWRVSWTVTNNSSGNTTLGFRLYPAFNLNGSTTFNASATGSAVFAWPQIEVGSFASPPILTSGTAATANGPQQVIDIGSRAALGVGFIIDATVLETASTFSRLIEISDGTGNNVVNAYIGSASNNLVFGVASGGVVSVSMNVTTTALATGRMVLAGVAGENYAVARVVGQSAPTPDTTVTFPTTLSKVSLLGRGSDAARNSYGYTKRLALWYGPMSAHFFDNVLWPKAQLLAQQAA